MLVKNRGLACPAPAAGQDRLVLAGNLCRSREQVIDDRVVQCVAFLGPDLPGRVGRVLPVGGQAVGSCFLEACLNLGAVLGVLGVGERPWAVGTGAVCFGWLWVLVLPQVGDWRLAGAVRVVGGGRVAVG